MKILFVCKYNRFRSQVAETIFNKLNKNPKIKAESLGLELDPLRPYIAKEVISILKEKGYDMKGKPEQATKELAKKYDLIVIVADNLDEKFFSDINTKTIKWKIQDCPIQEIELTKKIINQIEIKVKGLISEKTI